MPVHYVVNHVHGCECLGNMIILDFLTTADVLEDETLVDERQGDFQEFSEIRELCAVQEF